MGKPVKQIELTPTWRSAVKIYCAVLQNPNAGINAIKAAEEDLLVLADSMDKVIADNKAELEK